MSVRTLRCSPASSGRPAPRASATIGTIPVATGPDRPVNPTARWANGVVQYRPAGAPRCRPAAPHRGVLQVRGRVEQNRPQVCGPGASSGVNTTVVPLVVARHGPWGMDRDDCQVWQVCTAGRTRWDLEGIDVDQTARGVDGGPRVARQESSHPGSQRRLNRARRHRRPVCSPWSGPAVRSPRWWR